jgi:hypothetical protein
VVTLQKRHNVGGHCQLTSTVTAGNASAKVSTPVQHLGLAQQHEPIRDSHRQPRPAQRLVDGVRGQSGDGARTGRAANAIAGHLPDPLTSWPGLPFKTGPHTFPQNREKIRENCKGHLGPNKIPSSLAAYHDASPWHGLRGKQGIIRENAVRARCPEESRPIGGILQSHLAKTDLRRRLEFGTAYLTKEYPPVG